MADLDTLHSHAQSSVTPLKKIISSQGSNSGTFYFVKGNTKGESGIVIFLQKMDKKGAKARSTGKILRKASGGTKFCVGTVKMEGSKLCFRVSKGSAGSSVVAKSFKEDFKVGEFKLLGNLLRKAKVFDGEAETAEVPDVPVDPAEPQESEDFNVQDLADIEADLTKIKEDLETMQANLVSDLKDADSQARSELLAILNAEKDLANDMVDVQNLYYNLLEEELIEPDADEIEWIGIDGEDLVIAVESLYKSDRYTDEDMQEIARQLSQKGVDLSTFENQASVGNKMPEPLRSQILLSKKIQDAEEEGVASVENFPASLQPIWASIQDIINNQNNAIVSNLDRADTDFVTIGQYISSGGLFDPFPSDLDKALSKISSSDNTTAIQAFQKKLLAFNQHILTSAKIEACDTFVGSSNIRTLIVPKLNQIVKIIDRLPKSV